MREELKVTRRNYLQQKVLYQALTSVTKAKLCQGDSDGRTKRLFQLLQRSTAVADSTQSLSLTPSQNILGVLGRHLEQADVLYGSDRKVAMFNEYILLSTQECIQPIKLKKSHENKRFMSDIPIF